MKPTILIDMNLAPEWVAILQAAGWSAVHWNDVGPANATDQEIMEFARLSRQIVMTQDLDFTILLALSHATGPSIVQIRARNSRPLHLGHRVIDALQQHEVSLTSGALVVVDEIHNRVRVLPM